MRKDKCDLKKKLWSEAVRLVHRTRDPAQSSRGWAMGRGSPLQPGPGQAAAVVTVAPSPTERALQDGAQKQCM